MSTGIIIGWMLDDGYTRNYSQIGLELHPLVTLLDIAVAVYMA
jgi:hypothetical protein